MGSTVLPSKTPVAEDPALSQRRFLFEGSQVDLPGGLDLHVAPILQSPVSFEGSQTRLRVSGPISHANMCSVSGNSVPLTGAVKVMEDILI